MQDLLQISSRASALKQSSMKSNFRGVNKPIKPRIPKNHFLNAVFYKKTEAGFATCLDLIRKGRNLTILCIYENPTAAIAASAESAEPYVSELSSAFVRFSNPYSRQSERWSKSAGFARVGSRAERVSKTKIPHLVVWDFCFGDPYGNRTHVFSVRG